jgi:hypothetical protein
LDVPLLATAARPRDAIAPVRRNSPSAALLPPPALRGRETPRPRFGWPLSLLAMPPQAASPAQGDAWCPRGIGWLSLLAVARGALRGRDTPRSRFGWPLSLLAMPPLAATRAQGDAPRPRAGGRLLLLVVPQGSDTPRPRPGGQPTLLAAPPLPPAIDVSPLDADPRRRDARRPRAGGWLSLLVAPTLALAPRRSDTPCPCAGGPLTLTAASPLDPAVDTSPCFCFCFCNERKERERERGRGRRDVSERSFPGRRIRCRERRRCCGRSPCVLRLSPSLL